MTAPIVLEYAGDPPAKGRPRFSRRSGVAYTPAKTRQNESALRFIAQQVMGDRPPLMGAIKVAITAVFPIAPSWSKRKQHAALMGELHHTSQPDVDNLIKTLDALNRVCWHDDAQIVRAEVTKLYGTRPRMVIEIEEIST
jgi:Holliday junction resolvase RusA-like endonuclease